MSTTSSYIRNVYAVFENIIEFRKTYASCILSLGYFVELTLVQKKNKHLKQLISFQRL